MDRARKQELASVGAGAMFDVRSTYHNYRMLALTLGVISKVGAAVNRFGDF